MTFTRHTQKAQLIINSQNKQILATAFGKGSTHDFQLFKNSRSHIAPNILCLADSGYQGIAHLHVNSRTPAKKSKLHPLTPEQKSANRKLAAQRIAVEHVIAKIKVFRILSERYRNRRARFSIRFNLVAAIYNSEIHP